MEKLVQQAVSNFSFSQFCYLLLTKSFLHVLLRETLGVLILNGFVFTKLRHAVLLTERNSDFSITKKFDYSIFSGEICKGFLK